MSTLSNSLEVLESAIATVTNGFVRAGAGEDEINRFLAAFFGDDGEDALEAMAFQFALDLRKQAGHLVDSLDLGDGDVFLIEKYEEIEVNYTLDPKDLVPRYYRYIGVPPANRGTQTVKIAIGTLSKGWSEEGLEVLLSRSNGRLKGSGAWVCRRYIELHPEFNGEDSIGFPDPEFSRWVDLGGHRECFPYSRDFRDGCLSFGLNYINVKWDPSNRICLVCE